MKYIDALLFCLAFFTMQGQGIAPKVGIDTISFKYDFVNVATYDVSYPQLQIRERERIASRINWDIAKYFATDTLSIYNASVNDSVTINEVIAERAALMGEGEPIRPDEFSQGFEVTYLDGNLISILVSTSVFPAGGRLMFDSYGLQYSLLSGKKLEITDFINISPQQLTEAFLQHGYQLEPQNEQVVKREIYRESSELDAHIESFISKSGEKTDCTEFYFKKEGNDIHLVLRLECAGPLPLDIGVSLEYLKPYLTYYEFKNHYKLWGEDIKSLIGKQMSPTKTGSYIEFGTYSIVEGGGTVISDVSHAFTDTHAVGYWHSDTESFYVFEVKKPGTENFTVTDVLAIPREDIVKYRLIDSYCETAEGGDPEIIALVNDKEYNSEYYTKIIKAWRANRTTGKFELVKPRKVKRCGNEGYGADED